MALPSGSDYNLAVQNPTIVFTDPELRACRVEETPLGLPKPYSGGFTTTYRLERQGTAYAVRCFTRELSHLRERYQQIGTFLGTSGSRIFVPAQLIERGIQVNGYYHPIIKMSWASGVTLNAYVAHAKDDHVALDQLVANYVDLVGAIEGMDFAHGDLQHGNILVDQGQLKLIDYDGFYLPSLRHLLTNELGHINYQHPARTQAHFDARLDRFSTLVIYLGLMATRCQPALWGVYDTSENMLFTAKDFRDPGSSALIRDLRRVPDMRTLTERFVDVCLSDYSATPTLTEFLALPATPKGRSTKSSVGAIEREQFAIVSAADGNRLNGCIGNRVEVVGKVDSVHRGQNFNGSPYAFLNFSKAGVRTFTVVLWEAVLDELTTRKETTAQYEGQWVSVVGVVSQHNGTPQIVAEMASQLRVISQDGALKRFNPTSILPREPVKAHTKPFTGPAPRATPLQRPKGPSTTLAPSPSSQPVASSTAKPTLSQRARSSIEEVGGVYWPIVLAILCGATVTLIWGGLWGFLIGAVVGLAIHYGLRRIQ